MSVPVFINNVKWEVNFEVHGLIFCKYNVKNFALLGNLKHNPLRMRCSYHMAILKGTSIHKSDYPTLVQ
mgnify:CR=1 FL=1